jgi:uridine kinase
MINFKDKHGNHKIPLLKSRLFWAGLLVKLVLSALFASDYLRELFTPFGNYFISSGFQNPYDYFAQFGQGTEFPYPPLMLWIFSSFRAIFWIIAPGTVDGFSIADSLLYRIPLLIADLGILFVLMRWLKTKTRQVLIWYWLSPVLIYINYFHGQLDVIPMAFLVISLYFLFKNKWLLSFLLLGLAIGSKTNMVLVMPFYFVYLLRTPHVSFAKGFASTLILILVIAIINLPYIGSEAYRTMVYNNPVQQQVFDFYYEFNEDLVIYFIPAIYFVLVLWYLSFRFVNRDQLILFLAFTFLALTLMIAPMQGWYYWVLPLLVYFVIKQGERAQQLFALLSILYFVYFAWIPDCDYLTSFNLEEREVTSSACSIVIQTDEKGLNIAFTLLQTALFLTGLMVYRKGISTNIQAKFLSQPYIIGIGGDSAAGKSTLTNALSAVFEPQNTEIIRGDDMHKWERGNENWQQFTHLDPRANKLHEDVAQAMSLKTGQKVKRSFYDHNTGKFTLPKFIKPNKLIVFEGLHSFYLQNQANVYDLKIFMEPAEDLRIWWKVQRDVSKRGYSPEQVLEQLKKREEDSVKYIQSQSVHADIVASFFSTTPLDPLDVKTQPELALKIRLANSLNMDNLLDKLKRFPKLDIKHEYEGAYQTLTFNGTIKAEELDLLTYQILPELEEIGVYNAQWKNDYEGLLQLITVYIVFEKMK